MLLARGGTPRSLWCWRCWLARWRSSSGCAARAVGGAASVPARRRRIRCGAPATFPVAGLGAALLAALFAALPFIAAGRVGVLGVGLVNDDMASHLLIRRWIDERFRPEPVLIDQGYPLGPHALVAGLVELFGSELDRVFAGLMLAIPALTALVAYAALDGLGMAARVARLCARPRCLTWPPPTSRRRRSRSRSSRSSCSPSPCCCHRRVSPAAIPSGLSRRAPFTSTPFRLSPGWVAWRSFGRCSTLRAAQAPGAASASAIAAVAALLVLIAPGASTGCWSS